MKFHSGQLILPLRISANPDWRAAAPRAHRRRESSRRVAHLEEAVPRKVEGHVRRSLGTRAAERWMENGIG
jgi:hypothetical protein